MKEKKIISFVLTLAMIITMSAGFTTVGFVGSQEAAYADAPSVWTHPISSIAAVTIEGNFTSQDAIEFCGTYPFGSGDIVIFAENTNRNCKILTFDGAGNWEESNSNLCDITVTSSAPYVYVLGTCIEYTLNEGTGCLSFTGSGKLPDYEGYLQTPWYNSIDYSSVKSIVIGNEITRVGNACFTHYEGVESIELNDVQELGDACFFECSKLVSLSMPNVTKIEDEAFELCSKLSSVDLSNITEIPGYAFYRCSNLTSVTFSSTPKIGNRAFAKCSLSSITFPADTQSIVPSAFEDNDNLTTITFEGACPDISSLTMSALKGTVRVKNANLQSFLDTDFSINGELVTTGAVSLDALTGWRYEIIDKQQSSGGHRSSSTKNPEPKVTYDKNIKEYGESTVVIKDLDADAIKSFEKKEKIVIDLSKEKQITDVIIGKKTAEQLAKETDKKLELKYDEELSILIDGEAMDKIADQAKGETIDLSFKKGKDAEENLSEEQKQILRQMKDPMVMEVTIVSDNAKITNFQGETIEINLGNKDGKKLRASCIDNGVVREKLTNEGNRVKLDLSHLSHYVIEEIDAASDFTDIYGDAYYRDAVGWAADQGITSGTDATHFGPDGKTTRAQMVTFLWRAAGSPTPNANTRAFGDVKNDDYFFQAVLWAAENGITSGKYDYAFAPNDEVTRAQTVSFIYRMAKAQAPASKANAFSDVAADAYYADAVAWAAEQAITSGITATSFGPEELCTRAQVVTFLYKYFK